MKPVFSLEICIQGGLLIGQHVLMNITRCGQCVYTHVVYCNNNDYLL